MTYYRITSGGKGIYEAVDLDCPAGDPMRVRKPDGSWLPKAGKKFPGAVSYWTEEGMSKYVESGMRDWHELVVTLPLEVSMVEELPGEVVYRDKYQVLITL